MPDSRDLLADGMDRPAFVTRSLIAGAAVALPLACAPKPGPVTSRVGLGESRGATGMIS